MHYRPRRNSRRRVLEPRAQLVAHPFYIFWIGHGRAREFAAVIADRHEDVSAHWIEMLRAEDAGTI